MRWFKHLSASHQDETLIRLTDKFGLEGYARFWLLIETIALHWKKNEPPSIRLPWSEWQRILKGKRKKLETFLECLANESKIFLKLSGNILEISYPNILKYKDEYSKKSRHSPDKVPPKSIEYRGSQDKPSPITPLKGGSRFRKTYPESFTKLWEIYPRGDGKGAAFKAFTTIAPSNGELEIIIASVEQHKKTESWLTDNGKFVPHLSKFLNQRRWEDRIAKQESNLEKLERWSEEIDNEVG